MAMKTTKENNQLTTKGSGSESTDKIFKPYWNSDQDEVIFKETLDRVHNCLEVASKYGGRVFGGFVRNILIPTAFEQHIYGYKDVDIWFQTEEAAELFVSKMGSQFDKIKETPNSFDGEIIYPFTRQQFILKGKRESICRDDNSVCDGIIVDVIVSKDLPVDDFNVNQLTYSTTKGYKSFGAEPVEKLMSAIVNKKATMLPGYTIGNRGSQRHSQQTRRINRMLSCGWIVVHQDGNMEFN